MAKEPEPQVTIEELKEKIRSVLEALRNHHTPTPEIHEVVAELGQIEMQFLDGHLPVTPLRVVLGVIAQFEYTPWRIPTVVEDLHKIWSLLGML
jgi:uracil phosphoribosyltransferase